MNYYTVPYHIHGGLPRGHSVVGGAANTGYWRPVPPGHLPRHRSDAGASGARGISSQSAIAAAAVAKDRRPGQQAIRVEGDSGSGISWREVETSCRYHLLTVHLVVIHDASFL